VRWQCGRQHLVPGAAKPHLKTAGPGSLTPWKLSKRVNPDANG
jgi:hypothetical protein